MAYIKIYGTLTNATPEGKLAEAQQIFDNSEQKNQQTLNTELKQSIESKVDKESGKSLVSDTQITKLEGLSDQQTINSAIADAKKAGTDASNLATQNKNTIDNYTINGQKISTNPSLTKNDVGLNNVTNEAQIPLSQRGIANGVATLDDDAGKVPSSQLPSYVDDVLEYDTYNSFPETGESGKIYIDKQTNKQYRWGGTAYTEISKSLALGETSSTAYPGDKGKQTTDTLNSHVSNTSNPHNVTKAQVGLGNVDNTSDTNKPVSTAQQEAINSAKTEAINTVGSYTINGKKINTNPILVREDVGLGNVDNTSDLDKPISTATQAALDLKADKYVIFELRDFLSDASVALISSCVFEDSAEKYGATNDPIKIDNVKKLLEAYNENKIILLKLTSNDTLSNQIVQCQVAYKYTGISKYLLLNFETNVYPSINYDGSIMVHKASIEFTIESALGGEVANWRAQSQEFYCTDDLVNHVLTGSGSYYYIGDLRLDTYKGNTSYSKLTSNDTLQKMIGKLDSKYGNKEDGGTGDITKTISPNVFYQFGEVTSLNLTLDDEIPDIYNEYMFQFTSGATATVLTLPETVKWIGDHTVDINKTYQVSIVNNIGVLGGA